MAFAVSQRTREIGVRVALGAQTRDVVVLVASEGAWIALAGLAVGVLAAWILRRSVESMLFGVAPDDALTFGGVALLLGVVSLLAAYLPARSAARIDPACGAARGVRLPSKPLHIIENPPRTVFSQRETITLRRNLRSIRCAF